MRKVLRFLIPALVLAAGLGAYFYSQKRLTAKDSPPASEDLSPEELEKRDKAQRDRLEQSIRTMEETRRLNERARGPSNVNPTADVMRSLQTIQEINRLNRMNQELKQRKPPQ